jgi:hypothetical protein
MDNIKKQEIIFMIIMTIIGVVFIFILCIVGCQSKPNRFSHPSIESDIEYIGNFNDTKISTIEYAGKHFVIVVAPSGIAMYEIDSIPLLKQNQQH